MSQQIVHISSSACLKARKRKPGALRQHSLPSLLTSPPELENVRQRSVRKLSYNIKKKPVSQYLPSQRVRQSFGESGVWWLKKPMSPSFLERTESQLLLDEENFPPQEVRVVTQLSELEAIAIATVFEHIETVIGVLNRGDPNELDDTNIVYYQTLNERFYGKPLDLPLLAGPEIGKRNAREFERRECMKLLKILHLAINELAWFGSYGIFRTATLIPHIVKEDEKQLTIKLQKNIQRMAEIREQIRGYSMERKKKVTEISTDQQHVQGYLKKLKFYQSRDFRYLDRWNEARKQQHTYSLIRIEKNLKKKCEELERKIKLTVYANNNITLFLRMDIRDLRNKTNYFEKRRAADSEALEHSVSEVRMDLEDLQRTTFKARLLLGNMKAKVERMRARKKQIIEDERLLRVREAAAIKIQRWWRYGLFVKSLKKKKKKGKKGENEKKKK